MAEIPGLVGHRLGFYRRPCEAVAKKACQPKTNTDLKNSYNRPLFSCEEGSMESDRGKTNSKTGVN